MSNKFEQLLDYIINEEQDKAKELFHEIVVDKSREIYEGLIDEQDLEAIEEEIEEVEEAHGVSDNEVEDFVNDIKSDEEGLSLEDAEEDLEDVMDMDADAEGDEEEVSPEENEERISDLESAFAELQAEFDALMGGDAGEEEVAPEEEEEIPFESVETDEEPVEEAKDEDDEEKEEDLTEASLEAVPAPTGGNSDGKAMSHNRGAMKPSAANAKNLNQGGTGTDGAAPSVDKGGMDTKADLENESK